MTNPASEGQIHPSRAVRVTFFEDRAEVLRQATLNLVAGLQWVSIAGVSPFLDDRSVQAKVTEPVRILAARVRRRVSQRQELGREDIAALEEAEQRARERVAEAAHAIERAHLDRERLTTMLADWGRSVSRVPFGASQGKTDEWRRAYRAVEAKLAESLAAESEAAFTAQDARDELERAATRLAQARVTRPVCEAFVEVQVLAPAPSSMELQIVYRTPCALWRPEHVACLSAPSDDAKAGKLELTTWATVWQSTGEAWDAIEVVFSTARPARAASPPLLRADAITLRRKSDEERRAVHVEAREQAIATTGAAGARTLDEMPGVDDGGLPLAFSPGGTIALPSHGRPFRVEIARVTLEAKLARVALPELAPIAHYKATATLTGRTPVLAGPVRIVRGAALVGRARLGFVAPGEPLALGFGLDDNVRLRRTEETKQEQTAIVGTQKTEKKVRLFLANLSDAAREVTVTERIPVSEIGDVQIELKEARGWQHDERDGFVTAEVMLAPRETRELQLTHEIRAKANVVM